MRLNRLFSIGLLLVLVCLGPPRGAAAEPLIVSGAASLINAMTEIKAGFEKAHPQWEVFVNFAASGQLLQQIEVGAPVDVFVPADQETMDRAQKAGRIDEASRVDFTANDLLLVVPADTRDVSCLADLGDDKVGRVALGEPDAVPAGSYTRQTLTRAGLWERLESKLIYGLSVKQALDYVALGEVDAAFVYATDARLASRQVRVVANMDGHKPIVYPAALVKNCLHQDMGRAFLAYLQSADAQAVMARHGFKTPQAVP